MVRGKVIKEKKYIIKYFKSKNAFLNYLDMLKLINLMLVPIILNAQAVS
jgi:hypothetical protein